MSRQGTLALLAMTFFSVGTAGAGAADLPAKAQQAPPESPFFLLIDNRVTFAWMPKGTTPAAFSTEPSGAINGTTAKQVYAFTHFDIWTYGTNFFLISALKSDHNDPAGPCTNAGVIATPGAATKTASCAGAVETFGQFRSTFGWNDIFGTKAFTIGPLRNISFEVGMDATSSNSYLSSARQDAVAGLQFQFDLPYNGYVNVAPLAYWEYSSHSAVNQCGSPFAGQVPGVNCLVDGNKGYNPTWAVETNYYMDLGFLPEAARYFAISGRAAWIGPKGGQTNPLPSTATAVEFNSEPIRLTFDASKAAWGPKYSHYVELWLAYRYWQNKTGLDHAVSNACNVKPGVSNNTCTASTLYTGITMKF